MHSSQSIIQGKIKFSGIVARCCLFSIVFILSFFLYLFVRAAELDFPMPQRTEVIEKGQRASANNAFVTMSRYRSELPIEQIMSFYEKELVAKGWKKFRSVDGSEERYRDAWLYYVKDGINTFTVFILPSSVKGKVFYNTMISQPTKIVLFLSEVFKTPRQLDFMPVSPAVTEFVYNTYYPLMIGLGYLTHSSVDTVSDFYLQNMSKFGWSLVSRVPQEGMYNLSQWIKIVDPFTKAVPNLEEIGFVDLVPPLAVRGKTLTFAQGKKSCTITIYTFGDIIAKAVGTMFDMSFMEKHGTTLICIYYFYDEKK